MLLVIHFARFGPYHLARVRSACEVLNPLGWRVAALEIAASDAVYDWEKLAPHGREAFEVVTLFPGKPLENISPAEMKHAIGQHLDAMRPDAMAIAGWGSLDARLCLKWCKQHQARAIVMSETRAADGRRVWWKEWAKSLIVRRFDAALCGGESHRRYLMRLGIPGDKIVTGYNTVDNAHFSNQRMLLKNSPERDKPFFLASNRFVERKNLANLVRAYAKYVRYACSLLAGPDQRPECRVWPLVLLGDGELRDSYVSLCAELGLRTAFLSPSETLENQLESFLAPETHGTASSRIGSKPASHRSDGVVVFAGFRQIAELPRFYAGAGAFVHPAWEEPWGLVINEAMASGLPVLSSKNVGAAEELVDDGVTGFIFNPEDLEAIAESLRKISVLPPVDRLRMGEAARQKLEHKLPQTAFGEGLAKLLGFTAASRGKEVSVAQ